MGGAGVVAVLLHRVPQHSTVISNIWLTVLFIQRVVILVLAAQTAWAHDQSLFVCISQQTGCTTACYDFLFPVSHIQYWALQLLLVTAPTLVHLGYVIYLSRGEEKTNQLELHSTVAQGEQGMLMAANMQDGCKTYEQEGERSDAHRTLIRTHTISVVVKVIIEAGFLLGQWYLFDFYFSPFVTCTKDPCTYYNSCYIPNTIRKAVFTIIMMVVSALSILFNQLELILLFRRKRQHRKMKSSATKFSAPIERGSPFQK
ncbi:gap junction alpha-2 protein-like [Pleurodeles waltl]|uniref:gap junction alpha-2 protein-like n=1 Tax=Pleurodeles waltl TaxID=8319 RepID=UPI0037094FF3